MQVFVEDSNSPPEIWAHAQFEWELDNVATVAPAHAIRALRQFGSLLPEGVKSGIGDYIWFARDTNYYTIMHFKSKCDNLNVNYCFRQLCAYIKHPMHTFSLWFVLLRWCYQHVNGSAIVALWRYMATCLWVKMDADNTLLSVGSLGNHRDCSRYLSLIWVWKWLIQYYNQWIQVYIIRAGHRLRMGVMSNGLVMPTHVMKGEEQEVNIAGK